MSFLVTALNLERLSPPFPLSRSSRAGAFVIYKVVMAGDQHPDNASETSAPPLVLLLLLIEGRKMRGHSDTT
ncbi:hypothetical protein E2C01_076366 [Portunus trituberculatus]|uniref:Uncharacterized protein n=1 Tax=Portunus trituberculatus TaxID=210409 RepID=A0A5B7IHM3_PORTR|nr:hypothetical protein [Portunus trituberculatus]